MFVKYITVTATHVRVRENRQFLSTGMEFSKNAYAYLLKASSRN